MRTGEEVCATAAGAALVRIGAGDPEVAEQLARLDPELAPDRRHLVRDPLRQIDPLRYIALVSRRE